MDNQLIISTGSPDSPNENYMHPAFEKYRDMIVEEWKQIRLQRIRNRTPLHPHSKSIDQYLQEEYGATLTSTDWQVIINFSSEAVKLEFLLTYG